MVVFYFAGVFLRKVGNFSYFNAFWLYESVLHIPFFKKCGFFFVDIGTYIFECGTRAMGITAAISMHINILFQINYPFCHVFFLDFVTFGLIIITRAFILREKLNEKMNVRGNKDLFFEILIIIFFIIIIGLFVDIIFFEDLYNRSKTSFL